MFCTDLRPFFEVRRTDLHPLNVKVLQRWKRDTPQKKLVERSSIEFISSISTILTLL